MPKLRINFSSSGELLSSMVIIFTSGRKAFMELIVQSNQSSEKLWRLANTKHLQRELILKSVFRFSITPWILMAFVFCKNHIFQIHICNSNNPCRNRIIPGLIRKNHLRDFNWSYFSLSRMQGTHSSSFP